jgi:hypothetical protein
MTEDCRGTKSRSTALVESLAELNILHRPGSIAEVLTTLDDEDRNAQVQGLCDTVLVRIDNLRPSEKQYRESNFLSGGSDDYDDEDFHM